MQFVDQASVKVSAGDGGAGRISFRHEKFVDRGGPDGGDGGDGGSVIFVASRNQNTLVSFRFQKELAAEPGKAGGKSKKHGRKGRDLEVFVPVGTVVSRDDVEIADLASDGARAVIAKGGRGGFGNAHFISSVRQAPKFAEPGGEGERLELQLELKLIADIGLVGLPNAGKSTFLSVTSNARPKIADYPFTTLTPNLGVVDIDKEKSFLVADIPGLIEGAAEGKGLGDEFLRHVERTAVLLHLVAGDSEIIAEDYKTIEEELAAYRVDLTSKPRVVAITKTDLLSEATLKEAKKALKKVIPKDVELYEISAVAHQNVKSLLFVLHEKVQQVRAEEEAASRESEVEEAVGLPVISLPETETWQIEEAAGRYIVSGGIADVFSERTDFSNEESVGRLKNILQKHGVMHELIRQGAKIGDEIEFKTGSFEL